MILKRVIRLCDNLDCWNIVSRAPWEMKGKHWFCCHECYIEWFKNNNESHNPMNNPDIRAKHLEITRSESFRKKASQSHTGFKQSPETIEKRAQKLRGREITWKDKLSKVNMGKKLSEETKAKISKSNTGRCAGDKHPNWQGGLSYEPYCPRFNKELKERIRAFFDYKCAICGKAQEDNNNYALACHHVEYNKQACCDGLPVCFAALCSSCHAKTTNSGDRYRWTDIIHRIIEEIYNGRSYFTKEEWSEICNQKD